MSWTATVNNTVLQISNNQLTTESEYNLLVKRVQLLFPESVTK